jgi:hypothetical protein
MDEDTLTVHGCAVLGEMDPELVMKVKQYMQSGLSKTWRFNRQDIYEWNDDCQACVTFFEQVSEMVHSSLRKPLTRWKSM